MYVLALLERCHRTADRNDKEQAIDLASRFARGSVAVLFRSTIHRSTEVHCYSACVASSGKLANKGSHVAFMMDEKVLIFGRMLSLIMVINR